ncbi:SDR family NAD(P)-dependent oxidoreductase [Legionella fallonii]|uniref:3-oxoacyl-[acyl-carrier-protein] reductase 1 n=1 Tax=Legionella fallonii LLAP-10 TaxID=1212491 RepID=A0A098G5G6_9GAMM|nr:glucose 1-dehydrogenase [Legionella fallonii]CEG57221.1 3-oxoacyl-[acyl-carrier-protein] reductase 1 [Legionella fallonii LLAP-10]
MKKHVVLITGALAGIGKATAFAFARKGANIVISGRRKEVGESLAKELSALGSEVAFIQADVRHESEVQSLVEQTVSRFGRLDVAVNNAGTEGVLSPILEENLDNYQLTFDTNVLGVFLCLKYELKVMMTQGSGSIINLSSVAGKKGFPGAAIYCASKHAVEGLTKVAALEASIARVRVNAVAPGPIQTDMFERFTQTDEAKAGFLDMVPLKRAGSAEEVANTIVFLASDEAPYITGQIVGIDGGLLA